MARHLLRLPEVLARYGRKKSALYLDIGRGVFPPPVAVGRSAAWPDNEVDAVIVARIAGRSEDQIRALVRELVAARANALKAA